MTGDNIIRMAREAGWTSYDSQDERFERFAELVRAEEREAICPLVYGLCWSDNNAERIVRAIRARGQS